MHSRQAVLMLLTASLCPGAGFSGERALEFTRQVVKFGPRPPGSPALAKTRAYILAELKKTGARVVPDKFTASPPAGPMAMENIIAHFPGTSGRAIVISGHYDTKIFPFPFAGANDGGSSTGFLLELARALAGTRRSDDVYLVWFDGEEAIGNWSATDGVHGSRHLAGRWKGEGFLPKIRALINVDMIGDRDLKLLNEHNSTAWLRLLIRQAGQDLGYAGHFHAQPAFLEDDHVPFLREGVASCDLIDFDYGPGNSWWHTADDTVDKLSAASFQVIGNLVLEVIRRLERLETKTPMR